MVRPGHSPLFKAEYLFISPFKRIKCNYGHRFYQSISEPAQRKVSRIPDLADPGRNEKAGNSELSASAVKSLRSWDAPGRQNHVRASDATGTTGEGMDRERLPYINFEDERLAGLTAEHLHPLVEEYYRRFPDFGVARPFSGALTRYKQCRVGSDLYADCWIPNRSNCS